MHLVPDEMVVAQEVQMFQGASKTCCPGGKHSGANHPLGIESLTRICRQAKGGAFSSFFVTASNLQLKPYFSSRVPAVKSLPCTTSLLVHAVQEQAAPTKGLKDSDVRTQPESNRERGDEDRSSRRRTLRAFRGGRVLPRRIDCLVSETAVAARWSDPGYAYPPAARGRTAGAANLIKHVAEEKGEEYGGKGGRLGERLNAVNSGADVGAVFEETRIGERVAVANVPRTRDRHSDFERQGDPSESHPPDLEAEDFGSGAWYPDAFVADSSWGGDQADLVQRILGPPGAVPVAKRPTINLSETMEMFRDRSTEGSFNPPSTSYGGSRDGLSRSTRREYWGALQGSAGEKFGREPNIGRGSGPEVDVLGRLKSTGSPPGGGFFEQRGEKDVWRRGGRISEGARKGDTWEEDLRSKGVMRDEGGGLEDHLRTGQRRGLLGQPRGSRRCVRDEDVVGGFMVPSVERVLGIEAGATHRKSGTGAELEPRFKSGFGVESDTGFGHNFKSQVAARESGLESRSQPESNVDVLDEELELFVERLGGMGNIAPASEASQEAGAFESISPRLDLGFARSDVSGGRFAPNGVRGVDKVTWSAQDRRSWTSPESSAEKMDDVLQSGDVQSFGASPFDTEPSLGVQNRPASRETPTFETRRWTSQPLDKPPSANIPPSDPSSPVEVLAPPSRNVLQPDPSHLVWGEKQELPPTAFYDEHFLERFQYTRPPPNRNLPLFLDIKGHDTSPELPMPPPYYNRNSTHEKSGPLPGFPHGRVPRSKLPGPLFNGKRPDYWVVNPNNNKLVVARAVTSAPRGKLPGVRKLLKGWTGRGLRTREEVLGGPLSGAEVADLIEGSVHDRREVYLGRDGLTWNMVGLIHTHWRRRPVCKLKCKGIFTVNMPKLLRELERSAGGRVIWQHCGTVLLFRGRNYHWKDPPVLEPPEDRSADKKLTQDTNPVEDRNPGGMGKLESLQLSKRMNREPPITWLDKNGYYGGLVHLVRTFFSEPKNDLAVIKCPQFVPGDIVKLAIQLKALVPADVFQVDKDRKQRIVLYRNTGWECPTDELTRLAETDKRPTYYPKGPPQERRTLRKVVEEQLLGEEEEDEGVWRNWGSIFDAPSDEEMEEL